MSAQQFQGLKERYQQWESNAASHDINVFFSDSLLSQFIYRQGFLKRLEYASKYDFVSIIVPDLALSVISVSHFEVAKFHSPLYASLPIALSWWDKFC